MDLINDWYDIARTSLTPSTISTIYTILSTVRAYTYVITSHLLSNPSVGSILLFLAILLVSLKILDMAMAMIRWWVRLFVNLALYGGVLCLGLWVYVRGIEGCIYDVQGLVSWAVGASRQVKREAEVERRMQMQADRGSYYRW